ncbi:acylneuraminate cytidylyltransferase family protein, partial [Fulvivirga sp. RKSG066]|uniref:cytidylyltransferase domain-containing protein n=1 Tax=Fulvivirga aurantia TaxID=2529383 RepID=UPI003CCD4A4C|nr:acylneuraminate cytidylyltransferase family protein [Fulvivirga aurantia]
MRDVTFFLPVRSGSQRVKNKNTRDFCGIQGGLVYLKLKQLMDCKSINSVVLSTNDEQAIRIAQCLNPKQDFIKVIHRPQELCLDSTPLHSLIEYVPQIVKSNHILWGHATTPFIEAED